MTKPNGERRSPEPTPAELTRLRAIRESMLGRWGTPADIAGAVHWLVSPQAAFVTGQVLPVNGGFRPA